MTASIRENKGAKVNNMLNSMTQRSQKRTSDIRELKKNDGKVKGLVKVEKDLLDRLHQTI